MKNIITMNGELFSYLIRLEQDILFSVESNDINKVNEILNKEDSHIVPLDFKEKMIFLRASSNFDKAQDIIKYMIFDYKISDQNASNNVSDKHQQIQGMFAIRNLKENLSSELDNNHKKDGKMKL